MFKILLKYFLKQAFYKLAKFENISISNQKILYLTSYYPNFCIKYCDFIL